MEHQSYYRIPDGSPNNVSAEDRPYQINGTGWYIIERPYLTNLPDGRKDYYLQYCLEAIKIAKNVRFMFHFSPLYFCS